VDGDSSGGADSGPDRFQDVGRVKKAEGIRWKAEGE